MKTNKTQLTSTKGRDLKVGDAISTFFGGAVQTSKVVAIEETTKSKRTLTMSDGAIWTVFATQTYRTAK